MVYMEEEGGKEDGRRGMEDGGWGLVLLGGGGVTPEWVNGTD